MNVPRDASALSFDRSLGGTVIDSVGANFQEEWTVPRRQSDLRDREILDERFPAFRRAETTSPRPVPARHRALNNHLAQGSSAGSESTMPRGRRPVQSGGTTTQSDASSEAAYKAGSASSSDQNGCRLTLALLPALWRVVLHKAGKPHKVQIPVCGRWRERRYRSVAAAIRRSSGRSAASPVPSCREL